MALVVAKKARGATQSSQMLELLNQILKLEYSLIVHYPRLVPAVRDHKARQEAVELGGASVHHADTVAKAISKLGGTPEWSFESFPDNLDIPTIFRQQLEKEKLALELHQRVSRLASDASMRDTFGRLAKEERNHILIVENILSIVS